MNDRLDRLQDWLDGLLSEEEEGNLADELLPEPGGAALVEEFAWVHTHLAEALGASGSDPGLLADRVVQEIEARQGERVRDRVLERLRAPARPGTTRIRPLSRPNLRAVRSAGPRRAPAGWVAAASAAALFMAALSLIVVAGKGSRREIGAGPGSGEPAAAVLPPEPASSGSRTPAVQPRPPETSPPSDSGPARTPPPAGRPSGSEEGPAQAARLERVRGEVYVLTGKGREPAPEGRLVLPGEGLETVGQASGARLRFPDGNLLDVGPNSKVKAVPPPKPPVALFGVPLRGARIVFLVDLSRAENLGVARGELRKAVSALPEGTRLNVLAAQDDVSAWSDGAFKALGKQTRAQALGFLDRLVPASTAGAKDLLRAAGERLRGEKEAATILLLSEGRDAGEPEGLAAAAREAFEGRGATIHVVAFPLYPGGGSRGGSEREALRRLAEGHGGIFTAR
jgi:hypothetical protein